MPTPTKLPCDYHSWFQRASELGVSRTLFSQLEGVHPASMLTEREFLTLRVVWPERISADKFPFPGRDSDIMRASAQCLETFPEFQVYLTQLRTGINEGDRALGVFMLVFLAILDLSHGSNLLLDSAPAIFRESYRNPAPNPRPSQTSATHATPSNVPVSGVTTAANAQVSRRRYEDDEQLVNTALLLFSQALIITIPGVKCQRGYAKCPFGTVKLGENRMIAPIDGFMNLKALGVPAIFAMFKGTPRFRDRNHARVFRQESAEMITWIMHDMNHLERKWHPRRRLIVSQAQHDIFLTLATYDPSYENFLKGESFNGIEAADNSSLLVMQEYGPWNIGDPSKMKDLATIIVSLVMETQSDAKKAKGKDH